MIKKLAKSIREYKKETILTPILVSFEVILEVLITYYTAKLIDLGISTGNMGVITKYGIILAIMALLALVSGVLSGMYCAKATAGFSKNLSNFVCVSTDVESNARPKSVKN